MIYFDHTYTADPKHRFLKRLEKLGFTLEKSEVEHPGRQFCRFIKLPQPGNPRKCTYLEFINVKSGGEPMKKPGISFGYSKALEKFHKKLVKDGRYRSKFFHKNYKWKEDNLSRLPGWNFVSFEGLGLRGLFPWLTEYESSPTRKKPTRAPKHRNGVFRHKGFVLEVNPKSEAFLSYLLGQKLKACTRLRCGTELYVIRSHRTCVNAVVLECKSLTAFLKKNPVDGGGDFLGSSAARIKNPSGMWDLLIVEA